MNSDYAHRVDRLAVLTAELAHCLYECGWDGDARLLMDAHWRFLVVKSHLPVAPPLRRTLPVGGNITKS